MRSLLLAFGAFAGVAPACAVFWAIILGPVMEPVWPALGDAAEGIGISLMLIAVLSGLAAYGFALRRLKVPLAFGLAPLALTGLGLAVIVSSLRFGF